MRIQFTKMQGLGNDFVMINGIHQKIFLSPEQRRFLADRHFGVGCDSILLVEAAKSPGVDFNYRIFNADGTEVEQCGNGARCLARFVLEQGLTDKNHIRVETLTHILSLHMLDDGRVTVAMGIPEFEVQRIPLVMQQTAAYYDIAIDTQLLKIGAVSMGNPHCTLVVDNVDTANVTQLAPLIQASGYFPQGVNVGFMQIVDRCHIRLRVYERGIGETLACGSGACAAVVIGIQQNLLDHHVVVELRGGVLDIGWGGAANTVMMTGAAQKVFEGWIDL